MIRTDVEMAEGWMEFERFVALLQGSVRNADLLLAKEAVGDIHFAITEISVSAPVEIQVEAKTERPLVRIPLQEELARSGSQVARISFSLRPVPVESPERMIEGKQDVTSLSPRLQRLRIALDDEDYRDRVRALKEVQQLGKEALPLKEKVAEMAKSDRSTIVRTFAEEVLKTMGG